MADVWCSYCDAYHTEPHRFSDPADAAFRNFLAHAAQEWLMSSDRIPAEGTAGAALLVMLHDLLGEAPADFMEAIIAEMVEIDAWNK